MATITIELSNETFAILSERAKSFGVTPEELVDEWIVELLRLPEDEFNRRIELSLWIRKNMEKYHDALQRLADS